MILARVFDQVAESGEMSVHDVDVMREVGLDPLAESRRKLRHSISLAARVPPTGTANKIRATVPIECHNQGRIGALFDATNGRLASPAQKAAVERRRPIHRNGIHRYPIADLSWTDVAIPPGLGH